VVSLAASPDGQLVASSALDSHIRIWNIRSDTHDTRAIISLPPAENWQVGFIGSSKLAVASGVAKSVKVYDVSEGDACGSEISAMALPTTNNSSDSQNGCFAQSVAVSPDGQRVACGAADGTVAVFDVGSSKFLHQLEGHNTCVRGLTFSPDGKTLFTASDDGHVHVYDAHNKSLLDALPGHEGWVLGVSASADGLGIATCGADSTVKLWDLRERKCAQTSSSQKEAVWGVAFNSNNGLLASVSDDKSVATFQYVA